MIELDLSNLQQQLAQFFWPFVRVGAFFMVIPMFGSRMVAMRVRLMLALAVTFALLPVLPEVPEYDGLSAANVGIIVQQLVIGAIMGFAVQVWFEVFVLGAQLIATQMGLGFASTSDPANGVSVVILGQYFLMIVMMLFLATNGHLIMIEVLAESFKVLPVSGIGIQEDAFLRMARAGTWMFAAATLIALPAVTALLIVNFAFGIMSRAAPQLNIFAIGFPFTMLMGLIIVWVTMGDGFLGHYYRVAEHTLLFITDLLITPEA
ncbi:MAG: flagellar biosynthetic protein FliR [Pontibacterium sp.]